jgi:hypothetical protein
VVYRGSRRRTFVRHLAPDRRHVRMTLELARIMRGRLANVA